MRFGVGEVTLNANQLALLGRPEEEIDSSTAGYGTGYWNGQNDPTGQNHNIYAAFLMSSHPDAHPVYLALQSGEEPMNAAHQWLRENVLIPDSAVVRAGAPSFATWYAAWERRNFPVGTATQPLTPAEILSGATSHVETVGAGSPVATATAATSTTSSATTATVPPDAGSGFPVGVAVATVIGLLVLSRMAR